MVNELIERLREEVTLSHPSVDIVAPRVDLLTGTVCVKVRVGSEPFLGIIAEVGTGHYELFYDFDGAPSGVTTRDLDRVLETIKEALTGPEFGAIVSEIDSMVTSGNT